MDIIKAPAKVWCAFENFYGENLKLWKTKLKLQLGKVVKTKKIKYNQLKKLEIESLSGCNLLQKTLLNQQ